MTWTKEKKVAYQKGYAKKHYAANKAKYLVRKKAFIKALQNEVDKIKESSSCLDCGDSYPACVMDFDHRDPSQKKGREFRISSLVGAGRRTQVFLEISKCDLVCSNCHRMRTHLGRFAPIV